MAFFKKLKERLFKSSSKIEEGLDAIVEDGGEEAPPVIADDHAASVTEHLPESEPDQAPPTQKNPGSGSQ